MAAGKPGPQRGGKEDTSRANQPSSAVAHEQHEQRGRARPGFSLKCGPSRSSLPPSQMFGLRSRTLAPPLPRTHARAGRLRAPSERVSGAFPRRPGRAQREVTRARVAVPTALRCVACLFCAHARTHGDTLCPERGGCDAWGGFGASARPTCLLLTWPTRSDPPGVQPPTNLRSQARLSRVRPRAVRAQGERPAAPRCEQRRTCQPHSVCQPTQPTADALPPASLDLASGLLTVASTPCLACCSR